MAQFILWGGPEKIIFSDGSMFVHTQPFLERFIDFQFSEMTMAATGLAPLTREDRAKILGLNYARIVGLDVDIARDRIVDDQFARAREDAKPAPYTAWKHEFASNPGEFRR
jgi:hypothetical protein